MPDDPPQTPLPPLATRYAPEAPRGPGPFHLFWSDLEAPPCSFILRFLALLALLYIASMVIVIVG